jgi:hypothetical protein
MNDMGAMALIDKERLEEAVEEEREEEEDDDDEEEEEEEEEAGGGGGGGIKIILPLLPCPTTLALRFAFGTAFPAVLIAVLTSVAAGVLADTDTCAPMPSPTVCTVWL